LETNHRPFSIAFVLYARFRQVLLIHSGGRETLALRAHAWTATGSQLRCWITQSVPFGAQLQ